MSDNTDELTLEQEQNIRDNIAASQPLISEQIDVATLTEYYQDATLPGFIPGINYLSKMYGKMRKVRGDGNCFYRAFLFGYLDILLRLYYSGNEADKERAHAERERILLVSKSSLTELVAVGYSEFTIETFHEEFVELLAGLFEMSNEALLALFLVENGQATYYTWFMRLLTAGYIKRDALRFEPFLDGGFFDIESYCKSEVEPMNKECEQLQIIALTEYLGVTVHIAYLDGRLFEETEGLPHVVFPDPTSGLGAHNGIIVHLLYRPGHYDILYSESV